jgi:hypothetical protein
MKVLRPEINELEKFKKRPNEETAGNNEAV